MRLHRIATVAPEHDLVRLPTPLDADLADNQVERDFARWIARIPGLDASQPVSRQVGDLLRQAHGLRPVYAGSDWADWDRADAQCAADRTSMVAEAVAMLGGSAIAA